MLRIKTKWSDDSGLLVAKLYRDSDWQEWRVKFFKDGVYLEGNDYHSSDASDAREVALSVLSDGY